MLTSFATNDLFSAVIERTTQTSKFQGLQIHARGGEGQCAPRGLLASKFVQQLGRS